MANTRGMKLGTQSLPLIVQMDSKRVRTNKEGKITGRYLTVQIDQSLLKPEKVLAGDVGERKPDSNPFLVSKPAEVTGPDGSKVKIVSHTLSYTESQYQKMVEAADKKVVDMGDGNIVLGVDAFIKQNGKKEYMINTAREMGPTKNPNFGKTTLAKQHAVTQAAKDFKKASRSTAVEADVTPAVEQEAELEA